MRSTVTRVLTALLVVAAILTAVPARAGRPLDTEDTGTVPAGSAEVELGIEHTRDDDDLLWAARAGIGDAVLGAKYRLRDESEAAPAVLAAVAVRLPTGDADRGLGLPGADITMLAVVGKRWGPLTLHGNAGYTIVSADRGADAWRLAASAEWAAGAR